MTTAAQYQRWAANARAMASDLSDGPTRDALLYVARSHEHEALRPEGAEDCKDAAEIEQPESVPEV
jgi:hypothetical protein